MDISTLADLKAEVVRKRNEARFNKVQGRDRKDSVLNLKSDPLLGKSTKKQLPEVKPKSGRVDPEVERRVQSALEMKARLYNQMKSGQVRIKHRIHQQCHLLILGWKIVAFEIYKDLVVFNRNLILRHI